MKNSAEYEAARKTANEASEVYSEACAAYRCGRIDDETFLAARVVFKASQDAFDAAFEKEQLNVLKSHGA